MTVGEFAEKIRGYDPVMRVIQPVNGGSGTFDFPKFRELYCEAPRSVPESVAALKISTIEHGSFRALDSQLDWIGHHTIWSGKFDGYIIYAEEAGK